MQLSLFTASLRLGLVETAKNETISALTESRLEESQTLKDDLEQHAETLRANFQLFKTMLDEWRPD